MTTNLRAICDKAAAAVLSEAEELALAADAPPSSAQAPANYLAAAATPSPYASSRWRAVCESSDAAGESSPPQASRTRYLFRRTRRAAAATVTARRALVLEATAGSRGGEEKAAEDNANLGDSNKSASSSSAALGRRGGALVEPAAATGPAAVVRVLGVPLPAILLALLVVHKCITDSLSQYTRTTGVAYSATTASILGEAVKVRF
jgi:hypothetical protein